ncbi:MAG TPA: cytochrome c [Stellaceae bacterium]|nr:cytochrome c [Stellaceae bacterium]
MVRRVLVMAAAAAALWVAAPATAAEHLMSDEDVAGLFASTCGFCHADGGREAGKGPQLMATKRSDAFIINRIKYGKEGRMPAFGDALTDTEIKSIVHYIRHLKPDE